MSEREVDVADMQCWVFRMAQTKWKLSPQECANLFQKHDVFGFLDECYDSLHLNSYACALADVETLLRNEGVAV